MIGYSGMIVTLDHIEKDPSLFDYDYGPEFSFEDVQKIALEEFDGHGFATTRMIHNGNYAISFLNCSNHDRGAMAAIERLFKRLASLGTGVFAICSLYDDEANDGHGGHWEFRLNDASLDNLGGSLMVRDFTEPPNS